MPGPSEPTVEGFTAFTLNVMRLDPLALPPGAPVYLGALETAKGIVSQTICAVNPWAYQQAVYNLAGDTLVNFAADEPGRTYFTEMRERFNIGVFVPGVVSSSSAVTSTSMETIEGMKGMQMKDLQTLKTPWGRQYMAIAQRYGSNVWGLS